MKYYLDTVVYEGESPSYTSGNLRNSSTLLFPAIMYRPELAICTLQTQMRHCFYRLKNQSLQHGRNIWFDWRPFERQFTKLGHSQSYVIAC